MPGNPFPLFRYLVNPVPGTILQVRLYQSGPPFSQFPSLADFVEASFAGYAPRTVQAPGPAQPLSNGYLYFQTQQLTYIVANTNIAGCTVNGWMMNSVDAMGNMLVACWGLITPPQPMLEVGNYLTLAPSLTCLELVTPP